MSLCCTRPGTPGHGHVGRPLSLAKRVRNGRGPYCASVPYSWRMQHLPAPVDAWRQVFSALAPIHWDRIRHAAELRLNYGEETITDQNLLDIARAGLPGLITTATVKAEEAIKGCDWEWWLRLPAADWVRLSIQAKKLNFAKQAYRLRTPLHNGRRQLQILGDHAQAVGSVPLYCFYNSLPPGTATPWRCILPYDPMQFGCSLVPLRVVRRAHTAGRSKTFEALHRYPHSIPWRCLFCSHCSPGAAAAASPGPFEPDTHSVATWKRLPSAIARLSGRVSPVDLPTQLYQGSELAEGTLGLPRRILVVDLRHEASS